MSTMSTQSSMHNYYQTNADAFCKQTRAIEMSKAYADFLPLIEKGTHILDLGSGSGRDTKYFLETGYKVTAIDGCEALVKASSEYTGQKTLLMRYEDMAFDQEFDAIWASAALLHLSSEELPSILKKLVAASKPKSYWFVSFKYGETEYVDEKTQRFFHCETEKTLAKLISKVDGVAIHRAWPETSFRTGRPGHTWLHAILKRENES